MLHLRPENRPPRTALLSSAHVENLLTGVASRCISYAEPGSPPLETGTELRVLEPHLYRDGSIERIGYLPFGRVGKRRTPSSVSCCTYLQHRTPLRFHPYLSEMRRRSAPEMPAWGSRCILRVLSVEQAALQSLHWRQIHEAGLCLSSLRNEADTALYRLALRKVSNRHAPPGWPRYETNPLVTVIGVEVQGESSFDCVSESAQIRGRRLALSRRSRSAPRA